MSDIHPTMARLYEAALALKRLRGQSEVAAALGMSPQRLNNWDSRGISQEGANKAQAILGINATWLLSGAGLMYVGQSVGHITESSRASQTPRPDFSIVSGAVAILRNYLEIKGSPDEWVADPVLLEVAYETALEFGGEVTASNVIDLVKVLAKRIRQGDGADEQRQVQGTGTEAG